METMFPLFGDELTPKVAARLFEKWAAGTRGWMFGLRVHPLLRCLACQGVGSVKHAPCLACQATGHQLQFHNGIDLGGPAKEGTPIYCPWDGRVRACWTDQDNPDPKKRINGLALRITHPDDDDHPVDETAYAHLSAWASGIAPGYTGPVKRGQIIAYVGNTGRSQGAHLHFITRVLRRGKLEVVDPLPFVAASCGFAEIPTHDVG